MLSPETLRDLQAKLETKEDIDRLHEATGLERELLLIIYQQKVSRDATRRYYKVKARVPTLHRQWRAGKPLLRLAHEHGFPPVLMAYLVLLEGHIPRKQFWKYVRDPGQIRDLRLRREILDLIAHDLVYAPEANERQAERGREGEALLYNWLDDLGVGYRTEKDLRQISTKTPDALLDKPLKFDGRPIHWIESKANFGDHQEVNRNLRKQLIPYTQLFGPGLVVYWYGLVSDVKTPPEIILASREFFQENGRNLLL
ncbi:MAG TPA: C15orf41 family protein [Candidatus Thermoplasmatota archaeon]|nr:C15orf41 family protein [Candidatus Thermoplasmatota archaeon]